MGCDIHIYSEARLPDHSKERKKDWDKYQKKKGKMPFAWQSTDPWGLYDINMDFGFYKKHEDGTYHLDYLAVPSHFRVYNGRNYTFFAALNNVRNYDNVPSYFDEERELPDDMSEVIKNELSDEYYHSRCYATLKEFKEMIEWSKKQIIKMNGVISLEQKLNLEKKEGYVFTQIDTEEIDEEEKSFGSGHEFEKQVLSAIVGNTRGGNGKNDAYKSNKPLVSYSRGIWGPNLIPVNIEWETSLYDEIGHALSRIIENLEYRKKVYNYDWNNKDAISDDDIRAIWWYDN